MFNYAKEVSTWINLQSPTYKCLHPNYVIRGMNTYKISAAKSCTVAEESALRVTIATYFSCTPALLKHKSEYCSLSYFSGNIAELNTRANVGYSLRGRY